MWLLNGRERLQLTFFGCVERCRIDVDATERLRSLAVRVVVECARQAEETVRVVVVVDVVVGGGVVILAVDILHSVSVCKLVER